MIRIMLVESDKLLCKEYALEIARDEEFALVAVTGRQSDAINILTEQEVDAVIVNLELEEGDGIPSHYRDETEVKETSGNYRNNKLWLGAFSA